MRDLDTTVTEVIYRAKNVVSVRLSMAQDGNFQAGQFLGVTLSSRGVETSRYLSFSSSPTEKGHIEFTKRLTGSDFSRALGELRAGDSVKIRYPMGKFLLDETRPKHAFLAGGIGITPIRSIWKDAFDRRLGLDMVLLFSNRSVEEVIFRDDFEHMVAEQKNYKVVLSLDDKDRCPVDWQGYCGYIDAAMIRREIPDHQERIFYICGPTAMAKSMADILRGELKVPEQNIRRESITGY